MPDSPQIPLTVLGGWLGAGKTTMVNRILSTATERIAVIVNDVGEVNIDADLIRANADDDGVIELTNGCVCCKVGDDLFATLAELSRRDPAPERIILEASGVAEPRQVTTFLDHPRITIDAVISLVDPKDFEYRSSGPPYGSLMRAQLAGADLVVATKLDLLEHAEAGDPNAALDGLRQFTKAQVIPASDDPTWLDTVMLGGHTNNEIPSTDEAPAPVATTLWRPAGPVDATAINTTLRKSGLLRAKGSVATGDGAVRVHLAGGRVEIDPLDDGAEPLNAIVLIGQTTDRLDEIAASLDAAISTS